MTRSQKKRNKISHTTAPDTATQNKTENTSLTRTSGKSKQKDKDWNNSNVHERNQRATEKSWSLLSAFNIFCGVVAVVGAGCLHAWYMYQLHENQLWFTNIQVRVLVSFFLHSFILKLPPLNLLMCICGSFPFC